MYCATERTSAAGSRRAHRTIRAVALATLALSLIGCVPSTTGDATLEQVLAGNAPRPPASTRYSEVEPNDALATALAITIEGSADLLGSIRATTLDRDFFELGPAGAGDRVTAEFNSSNNGDIVLALLDQDAHLLGMLDVSSFVAGPGTMDIFLHEDVPALYVLVTSRSTASTDRSYSVNVALERAAGVPAARPQVVVLNFQGASNISVGGRPARNIPPFDALALSDRFSGQTSTIISNVLDMTRETFEGLGVEIYLAGDPAIPGGARSTVYFGTYDAQLLGLADNIDPYNSNTEQKAILYTDTFALFDALNPDIEAISQAIANTTAHEIGHLLGLRHTTDSKDIMDTTASARQMMVRQWFRTSALNSTVMSFGFQDSPALLEWTLGGTLTGQPSGKAVEARARVVDQMSQGYDFYIPRCQFHED